MWARSSRIVRLAEGLAHEELGGPIGMATSGDALGIAVSRLRVSGCRRADEEHRPQRRVRRAARRAYDKVFRAIDRQLLLRCFEGDFALAHRATRARQLSAQ